jgi:hypothetical protein
MYAQMIVRALVVAEPWIGMILAGRKTWEMRSRATKIRETVGLIRKGSGTVVGVVRLVGCGAPLDMRALMVNADRHCIPANKLADAICAGWVVPWHLEDARLLQTPIHYDHPNGAVGWVKLERDVSAKLQEMTGRRV